MNNEIKDFLKKMMIAFPQSFIKCYRFGGFEIILDKLGLFSFGLNDIENVEELKRRFISTVSGCYKVKPYLNKKRNEEYRIEAIQSFNETLEKNFSEDEIVYIYGYLGNGCNRQIALEFVRSNYDFELLKKLIKERDK